MPVNPDGTAVSHTSMTQSSTHYLMDGYSAMMQKGKSFGNKKTQEITTTFEATFKLHKNFNVKADFSYTQGYLHNDYRSVNVQYSQYPGEVMTEPEGSFPNKYKEVVWDQNYYVADVYGTYNKTFSEKHNLTLIAGYNYEAKYYRDLTAANDGLLSEDLSDFNLAKGTTNFTEAATNTPSWAGSTARLTITRASTWPKSTDATTVRRVSRAASVTASSPRSRRHTASARRRSSNRCARRSTTSRSDFRTVRSATSRSVTTTSSRPSRPRARWATIRSTVRFSASTPR